MITMKRFTVVGIDGITDQRFVDYYFAQDYTDVEEQAYMQNPDLLIAAVFDGHIVPLDIRASSNAQSVFR